MPATDDGDVNRPWGDTELVQPPGRTQAAQSPANPDPRTRTRVAGRIAISSQPADSQTRAAHSVQPLAKSPPTPPRPDRVSAAFGCVSWIDLSTENSSSPCAPSSCPWPEHSTPPEGASGLNAPPFTSTCPVRSRRATRTALARRQTTPRPTVHSGCRWRSARRRLVVVRDDREDGPKISSWAILMSHARRRKRSARRQAAGETAGGSAPPMTSGRGRKFVGGLGPGGGVCEVEAAGGVEGVLG